MRICVRGGGLDHGGLSALRRHAGLVAASGRKTPVLADADIVPFLPAADLDRARQFYGERLGLLLLEQTGFAFQAPNATWRVTLVGSPAHAPYTVLGWQVPDIEVAVAELQGRSIEPIHYDASIRIRWESGAPRAARASPGSRIRTGTCCR